MPSSSPSSWGTTSWLWTQTGLNSVLQIDCESLLKALTLRPKIYWKHHGIFFWVVKSMPSKDFHNQFGEQNSVQFVSTTMMWYPRKMEMRMALFNSFQFIFHKSGQIQLLSSSVCFGKNKKELFIPFTLFFYIYYNQINILQSRFLV